ncbi:hypothetical protein C6P40_004736 [Pichia californica]|uniref:Uncharacterized protein n=1 Tax=Pichia californica TaxID=460514 RepID=A0A9P7BHX4_9ASCO|nr:hypothetical protein C6P42_004094 [[Candida] californica]KAG0691130.1 hypothetical protein C6P40_004736 [[Candida] californica]
MDALTFVTPANVRVLLVPINEISHTDFEKIIETLRRVKDVRAVDLIHNPGKFNPQAYPQGHIYFNFITRDDDTESLFLHDFEPFRKTAIVLGISKWNIDLTDDKIRDLKTTLKKKYSAPISQFTMIFHCPKSYTTTLSDVYTVIDDTSNMETKICDITSRFLSNFSTYASAYEHTTLRSPGNLNGNSAAMIKAKKKISGSFELNPEKVKQMSSSGRKLKLSANFYLMAGNLKSALSNFCEAIFNLKFANDYLWLASALDGLAVCLFLLSSIGAPYQLPQFIISFLQQAKDIDSILSSPISSPRSSLQININNHDSVVSALNIPVVPLETVQETIFNCGRLSSVFFNRKQSTHFDYLPQVVVSESLLRYASLMVSISANGKLDLNLIHELLSVSSIVPNKHISKDFDMDYFNNLCLHTLNSDFKNLSMNQQLKLYYSLISLYSMTNMTMKKCLMTKNFLDLIIKSKHVLSINRFEYQDLNLLMKDYCENYGIKFIGKKYIGTPNYLQKKILFQLLEFCTKIKHYEGYIHYSSILFSYFRQIISESEQLQIYQKFKDYSPMIENELEYWDKNMFLNFEFDTTADKIVEGEECPVNILLRNPFAFEVEVNKLKLITDNSFPLKLTTSEGKTGIDSESDIPSIFLRPYSEMIVSLILIPEKHGDIVVKGISASAASCTVETFISHDYKSISFLPKLKKPIISNDIELVRSWKISVVYKQPFLKLIDVKLSDKWLMLLDGEKKQFKVILKNTSNTEINHLISKFKDSTTDILNTELNNKTLQPNEIYEIEYQLLKKKPFKILNKSDLVKIKGNESFHLDVEISGKLGVNEANLVLEYSHQKNASSEFTRSLNIPVNLTVYPSVELSGCDIISLTSNTKISQGNTNPCWEYLRKMRDENHKLSNFCLLALDFVNMWSEEMEIDIECSPQSTEMIETYDSNDSIDKIKEGTFIVTATLHSRKNIRMFIPLLRMDLDEQELDKRIPSLRNKQFVIDKKTPIAEQTFIKHAFWYKEEILKRLNAKWRISPNYPNSIHSGKSGLIDLRSFRFSSKMIEVLEVEKIGLSLKLLDEKENVVDMEKVQLNTFYTVRLHLTNRNKHEIFGIIRHIPICKDPPYTYEKKILINGVLQNSVESAVSPGESRTYDLGIIFLEKGEYEWGALFDEIDGLEEGNVNIKKQHLQREQLKFKIQ